ncbi:MAG: FHA domain-containing protein [Verrucomicrobiales bacterium]|nr:FHA domain-containing protein [Verrucomicrobiales bacterium]
MASITLYVPEQDPIAIELDAYEQITIGRGPDNDLVLDHVSLSGSHAVIQNEGGSFKVTDLGSTNGTFVNGEQITEAPLVEGTRVLFGSVDSVFSDGGAAAPAESGVAESGHVSHQAHLAETSSRPDGFVNLSPIEKVVKKDTVGLIGMIVGAIGVLAAIGLIVVSASMSA